MYFVSKYMFAKVEPSSQLVPGEVTLGNSFPATLSLTHKLRGGGEANGAFKKLPTSLLFRPERNSAAC